MQERGSALRNGEERQSQLFWLRGGHTEKQSLANSIYEPVLKNAPVVTKLSKFMIGRKRASGKSICHIEPGVGGNLSADNGLRAAAEVLDGRLMVYL